MNTKINEKFYPLTPEVAKKLRDAKLTAAEWRIWSYLAEIEPWGDRYSDLDPFTVMQACDVSKATVYRAIAKFQELELFDFQDKGFSVKNQYGISKLKQQSDHTGIPKAEEVPERLREDYLKNETSVSEMRQDSQICESSLKNETSVSEMRQDSQICEKQTLEPLPDKKSDSPQTIQTYSDFKKTLSEGERENFLNFVKEQIKNLPKQVNDVEAWLANQNQAGMNRWEVYYNNFLASQKTENQSTRKNQSLAEEISQRREKIKERLRNSAESECPSKTEETPEPCPNKPRLSLQEEIEQRREKARKYLSEQRRSEARKRWTEQGGES